MFKLHCCLSKGKSRKSMGQLARTVTLEKQIRGKEMQMYRSRQFCLYNLRERREITNGLFK